MKPESAARPGAKRKAHNDIEMDMVMDSNSRPQTQLVQTKLFRTVDIVSQTTVDKLVTSFVVKGMHALSTVEQPEFIELVTGLCCSAKVMSRRTLGRRIDDSFNDKLQQIKETIAKVQTVCTTADVWSTPKRSFMGVTCHWIDPEFLIRKSAALACRRFTGAHTYDRIAELLCDINDEFGLSPSKVIATVTDNGANFVKAFKEFSVQVEFGVLQIDTDTPDDIGGSNAVAETESSASANPNEGNGDHASETVEFVDIYDVLNSQPSSNCNDPVIVLPTHERCCSHTLSLVATTDASKALKNSAQFARLNHAAMGKCSSLWNSCSRPKSAEKIFDICGSSLPTPCATRWNSMYDSLKGLLKKRDSLPKLMSELKLPTFKEIELEFLDEYCQILEPIAIALDRLQGERTCFYADLLPTLQKVSSQLSTLHSVNLRHCLPLLNAVTSGFNRRFSDFLQLSPEVNMAILATITHPYFKMRWLPQALNSERNRLQTLLVSTAKSMTQCIPPEALVTPSSGDSDDDYFRFSLNTSDTAGAANATTAAAGNVAVVGPATSGLNSASMNSATKCELEALQYLEDPKKDLVMLNCYPTIKQLFLRFNATLPSSAPVERLFSFAGIIARPHRRKIGDKLFEKLLLLKDN